MLLSVYMGLEFHVKCKRRWRKVRAWPSTKIIMLRGQCELTQKLKKLNYLFHYSVLLGLTAFLCIPAHLLCFAFGRQRRKRNGYPKKVLCISPSFFSEESLIGGGERYVTEFAKAIARIVPTTLVAFGPFRRDFYCDGLRVKVFKARHWLNGSRFDPYNIAFLLSILSSDLVHCFQYRIAITGLAITVAQVLGKPVYITDNGGVGVNFVSLLALDSLVTKFLPVSKYAANFHSPACCADPLYGGVSEKLYSETTHGVHRENVLFVGRLLPHKGIDVLISAQPEWIPLVIIGRIYNPEYFEFLSYLARGKKVRFITDASDDEIVHAYKRSLILALPSVNKDIYGRYHEAPELLGLVAVEAMAAGCVTIMSDIGAAREIINDGENGYIVPPGDKCSLRNLIIKLFGDPVLALRVGSEGRRLVIRKFTWDSVARRALSAYNI